MDLAQRIVACHRCPARLLANTLTCPHDARAIATAALTGVCPDGRFEADATPTPAPAAESLDRDPPGLGDTVAAMLTATGIGPIAKAAIERVTGKPCRCDERRKRLNRLIPSRL